MTTMKFHCDLIEVFCSLKLSNPMDLYIDVVRLWDHALS